MEVCVQVCVYVSVCVCLSDIHKSSTVSLMPKPQPSFSPDLASVYCSTQSWTALPLEAHSPSEKDYGITESVHLKFASELLRATGLEKLVWLL